MADNRLRRASGDRGRQVEKGRDLSIPTDAQLAIKPGDIVEVLLDDGSKDRARAKSEPWQYGKSGWVILLEGRSGAYRLSRCTPVKGRA